MSSCTKNGLYKDITYLENAIIGYFKLAKKDYKELKDSIDNPKKYFGRKLNKRFIGISNITEAKIKQICSWYLTYLHQRARFFGLKAKRDSVKSKSRAANQIDQFEIQMREARNAAGLQKRKVETHLPDLIKHLQNTANAVAGKQSSFNKYQTKTATSLIRNGISTLEKIQELQRVNPNK